MNDRSLKSIFSEIPVEPGTERRGPTLASYFERDERLCEALPNRIRGLIDLAHVATREVNATGRPHAPASRIVQHLWREAIESEPLPRQFKDFVRLHDATGALDLRDSSGTPTRIEAHTTFRGQARSSDKAPAVTFLSVDRFDAFLDSGIILPRPVTAAFMLAGAVTFDQSGGTWNGAGSGMSGYEGMFANSEYLIPGARSATYFPWPFPPGYSLPLYATFSLRWKTVLEEAKKFDFKVDEMALRFLHTLVTLLWDKATASRHQVKLDWADLADKTAQLVHNSGTRTKTWAYQRAGLLAAPEYGLSPDIANKWLEALFTKTQQHERAQIVEALRSERRGAIARQLQRDDVLGIGMSESVAQGIDFVFDDYAWRAVVEAKDPTMAVLLRFGALGKLQESLRQAGVEVPMTEPIIDELRSTWHQHLQSLADALEPYWGLADVQPQAMKTLWDKAVAISKRPDVSDVVKVVDGKLLVKAPSRLDFFGAATNKPADGNLPVSTDIRIELHKLDSPRVFVDPGGELDGPMRALYELIWDVAVFLVNSGRRADTMEISPLPRLMEWPGIRTVLFDSGQISVAWPAIRWPLFRQIHAVVNSWRQIVDEVTIFRKDASFAVAERVNALAIWLVEMSDNVRYEDVARFNAVKLRMNAQPTDWQSKVDSLNRPMSFTGAEGVRDPWLREIVLFGAPEYGLSREMAKKAIQSRPRPTENPDVRRKERIHCEPGADLDAAGVLAKLKELMPTHPWYNEENFAEQNRIK